MAIPLLTTKLSAPPLRNKLVARTGLIEKLNQGIENGFVLISAPAGYGKTTLLSAWTHQIDAGYAWVSLDPLDNDLSSFLYYLAAAFSKIDRSYDEVVKESLRLNPQSKIETLLIPLINHLSLEKRDLCLILDDYHVIQNQAVHQAVGFMLENRPALFKLVIATRADPPLPLSRLRAHSQICELRMADLRFSSTETAELLTNVIGLNITIEDMLMLETSTEGWVAGLQMAGLSLQGREDASAFIRSFSGENRYILDFLFEEVFNLQSQDIQNFLLQSSVLDHFCASLCNTVTQRENSQSILSTLDQNNLFLISLDEYRQWYRYHYLLSDLLRSHLKQSYSAVEIKQLHQRAAAWYQAEGNIEKAIVHALSAHDFEYAADLIEQIVKTIDKQNQQVTLSTWLDKIPPEVLNTRPWLCVYRAWGCYWTGRREEEHKWLQAAENSIEMNLQTDDPERQHILGHIAAVRAHTALNAENISRALKMGKKALKLLPNNDEMRCEAAMALAGAYWALGDINQTKQAYETARTAALKINYTSMAVGVTGFIAIQQQKQGDLNIALKTLLEGLRLATLQNGSEMPIAGFLNVRLGEVWREQNELDVASKYLIRGVEQCRHLGQPDILTDAYVCLGRFMVSTGNFKEAHDALQKADDVSRHKKVDPWVLCWLDDCRIRIWLAKDNLDAAALWVQSNGLSWDGPLNYQHDLHHQNIARVLVAQGYLHGSRTAGEKAEMLLARLQKAAEKAGWVQDQIKILIMQAVNHQTMQNDLAALAHLAYAVLLAEPGGYVRLFADEGKVMQRSLITLEKNLQDEWQEIQEQIGIRFPEEKLPVLQSYIRRLISNFDDDTTKLKIIKSKIYHSDQIEALTTRELEVLDFLAQGFSDKKIAKALVIAPETVHKHLKNIYGKLEVHSRTEAIARARDLGLL